MNVSRLTVLFAALGAVVILAAGCGKKESAESHAAAKPTAAKTDDHGDEGVVKLTDAEMKDAGVRTEKAEEKPVLARFSVAATIQPNRDRYAHVAPRVPGRVLRVQAKAGDAVKAGQILAELDSVELGEAHSAYLQAASQESVTRSDFERAQKLFQEQVVPEKDFLRARSEHEKARAAAQAAADKLRMMGIVPTKGTSAQSIFPVTAPFAGTVIERAAVIGELAQPDKSLFTVADLSTVWIEANLYEKDLARVSAGAAAEVSVQAYPNERFRGRLAYVSGVVDKESRTIKARIEVPNTDGRLKPEMFATVQVDAEARGKGFAVPTEAILLVDGKKVIFVKEVDGFEARAVELGEDLGGRQIVKSGLHAGEDVVVAGAYAIKARLQKSKIGHGHAH